MSLFGTSDYDTKNSDIFHYWQTHHDVKIPNCDDVAWETFGDVRQQLSMGLNRWVTKFWSGHIGVGNMLRHRGWKDDDQCPVCCADNEKSSHVLVCPEVNATNLFTTKVTDDLASTLDSNKTCPEIKTSITNILLHHRHRKTYLIRRSSPTNRLVTNAMNHQHTIGWTNFVLGRWSPLWQVAQAAYFRRIGSKRSPRRWAAAIIKKILMIVWDMWQFRNGVCHSSDGPEALAHHSRLNQEIDYQFMEGAGTLLKDDKHRIRNWTLTQVRNLDLVSKQNWVASIQAARKAFEQAGQQSGNGTLHAYFPPAPSTGPSSNSTPRSSP